MSLQELPYRERITNHIENIERIQHMAAIMEEQMLDSAARELARIFIKHVLENSQAETRDFLQNVREEDGT